MKLIDKDALVAEIEKYYNVSSKMVKVVDADYWNGKADAYRCVLTLLDTLEVKDVDSRLTLEDISILRQIMFDYNKQVRNEMSIPNNEDYCKEVLKRFKAQNGEKIYD